AQPPPGEAHRLARGIEELLVRRGLRTGMVQRAERLYVDVAGKHLRRRTRQAHQALAPTTTGNQQREQQRPSGPPLHGRTQSSFCAQGPRRKNREPRTIEKRGSLSGEIDAAPEVSGRLCGDARWIEKTKRRSESGSPPHGRVRGKSGPANRTVGARPRRARRE